MITRPLDLAAKLRPAPRNLDAMFFVNVGLLVLFFALFGSQFVLAPGLGVDFRLPSLAGATASARAPTHVITVLNSGQVLTPQGSGNLKELAMWLRQEAAQTRKPLLLVRLAEGTSTALLADVASVAKVAGFEVIMAAEEPPARLRAPSR